MSIVVAVRVGEGLVIAADSASTLMGQTSDGQVGVVKVFNHAAKVIQLRDYPMAVASWGAGNLGARTISSLVEEFANQRSPMAQAEKDLSVKTEAKELMGHLVEFYDQANPSWRDQPAHATVGVLVGGYSGTGFFPEEYAFTVPDGNFKRLRAPGPKGEQDFGANWFGMTDAVVRLHHGRDDALKEILKQSGVADDTVDEVMKKIQSELQYPVPFAGMPLQDAVDYAMFMVGVTVGRYRFVAGPELCGGAIDVATVTRHEGFRWVQRKDLSARPFGPPA